MKIKILKIIFAVFWVIVQSCKVPASMVAPEPKLEGNAYVSTQVALREERSLSSKTIVTIEISEEILILDNSDLVFYRVKYKDHIGYVSKNSLSKVRPIKSTYFQSLQVNTPGIRSAGKSADCRTVQCSGTTKKGARCKNMTTNCTGRCHLH